MEQWVVLKEYESSTPREEEFLENNLLDEKGFWQFCPRTQKWELRDWRTMKQRVVWKYHDANLARHPGEDKIIRSIQDHDFWSGRNRKIKRYVSQCHPCIYTKLLHCQPTIGQRPRSARTAWETLPIDLTDPYPLTQRGHRYILMKRTSSPGG